MVNSLSADASGSNKTAVLLPERNESGQAHRKHYFINEIVEWDLTLYIWTGCTEIGLRDRIMSNASELIRQIIRKQGMHTIYPGQDDASFGDLVHTGWCQVEKTLYKYRSRPHCRTCFNPDRPNDSLLYLPRDNEYGIISFDEVIKLNKGKCHKCQTKITKIPIVEPYHGCFGGSTTILYKGASKVFNMWSQISRTVILALIKRENRDKKNATQYVTHVSGRPKISIDVLARFLLELREITQYNKDHKLIIDTLEWLITNDERPYDGMVCKLVERTGLSRIIITDFFRFIRLRSFDFTDSPLNRTTNRKATRFCVDDPEDDNPE